MRLALYKHSLSAAHDKQFVAAPARIGFRDFLKYLSDPVEDKNDGR